MDKKYSEDLTGRNFRYLTVLGPSSKKTSNKQVSWECQCKCGKFIRTSGYALVNRKTLSCGCLRGAQESFETDSKQISNRFKLSQEWLNRPL